MSDSTSLDRSLMERVLAFFEARLDTVEIATRLGQSEAKIERMLHIGLANRRLTRGR